MVLCHSMPTDTVTEAQVATTQEAVPGLFGISNSNRDFSLQDSWGKNQFNNAFPVSLLNYFHTKSLEPVYITVKKDLGIEHGKISVETLFGINPSETGVYFAFEEIFRPFGKYVNGALPRVDVVIERRIEKDIEYLAPLEIKLTALPDNQTAGLAETEYGTEIVVRPDTIVYMALSFAAAAKDPKIFEKYLEPFFRVRKNWKKETVVKPLIPALVDALNRMMIDNPELQKPLMVQPVWKTIDKTMVLADNCLDIFVWSNFALTKLFFNQGSGNGHITRHERTVVWLAMMLYELAVRGATEHKKIIDDFTYNTKNDKAFATGGSVTHPLMASAELTKPRITKAEIKDIVLHGGEKMLSPERRFDAVVLSTADLF